MLDRVHAADRRAVGIARRLVPGTDTTESKRSLGLATVRGPAEALRVSAQALSIRSNSRLVDHVSKSSVAVLALNLGRKKFSYPEPE